MTTETNSQPTALDRAEPGRRIVSIGECMIEMADRGDSTMTMAYAGDTLNTAVYLARLNGPALAVDYVTALGDDPYSDAMVNFWREEGIGTDWVARLPGQLPGLYLIRTDSVGERSFYYYRSAAPARSLFDLPSTVDLLDHLSGADMVHFSGITLAILSYPARDRLAEALQKLRRGGTRIVFDGNYRPSLWPSADVARRVVTRFLSFVDLALPSADDEEHLFGDTSCEAVADRMHELGVDEVLVKNGSNGCFISQGDLRQHVPVPHQVKPVDTTGAGDSFNAGYLSGRIADMPPVDAARIGSRLAATVIGHRGAIIPRAAMGDLLNCMAKR
ncbi:sugar kinase [Telmatospirillum sp.]|uniref:sugar kinase n=1 Tax=Telmatospirillum sp. TaxID=2079197 RepID=UPI002844A000|nr:sugar kinase [Telmatospirillum sp.]MDR3435350.1 sugar kinase [Telmatospirillum sp.]